MKHLLHRFAIPFLLFSLTAIARTQTVDTAILGNVSDSSGAAIPGAPVTVVSPSTGITKTTVTGTQGQFEVQYLTPGSYDVTLQASGFAKQTRSESSYKSDSSKKSTSHSPSVPSRKA